MNKKIFKVTFALVLVLSFSLVAASPAIAARPIHVYSGDSIQAAIDSASNGAIIYVHDGEYHENIVIDGIDIKLIAVGDVTIDGATNIYANKTIAIYNSTCTIDGFTVKSNGTAIYAKGASWEGQGEVKVTIINNYVSDYIKSGIIVNGDLAVGFVKGNVVKGRGHLPQGDYGQNGIQFGWDSTGQIHQNQVSDNWYDGPYWTACGILILQASNISVKNNEVNNCQSGITVETQSYGGADTASYNVVANNSILNSFWGITVAAYALPWSESDGFANNNKVINNIVSSDGGDCGIYIGASYWGGSYTAEAVNNKAINNAISGFEYAIYDEGTATKLANAEAP